MHHCAKSVLCETKNPTAENPFPKMFFFKCGLIKTFLKTEVERKKKSSIWTHFQILLCKNQRFLVLH